jgi:hypothetical protein
MKVPQGNVTGFSQQVQEIRGYTEGAGQQGYCKIKDQDGKY